jgi:hypothetical protein|tara:strand:- start:1775 stop:1993 length:219 start_codon:yes stop_codon:yes gene_type:complete
MDELKKIYLRVKSQTNDFKTPVGNSFTGDELFSVTMAIQALYSAGYQVLPEDVKWSAKLLGYLQPFPVEHNV